MALRIRPNHSRNPLEAYAPAFDISNVMPALCKGAVHGLSAENWPDWLRTVVDYCADTGLIVTSEELHGALLLYIRALKEMQCDPDVRTVEEAFARTGFDKVDPYVRALVMARLMDYMNALFLVAIKDATELVEGGTSVRADIQAAVAVAESVMEGGHDPERQGTGPAGPGTGTSIDHC